MQPPFFSLGSVDMKRLFYGGRILTLASPLYAEAMLVEDGRILRTGEYSSLCEGLEGEVQKIDLGGRVIMPSFIDAHGHYNSIAASTLDCSVRGACSIEEIKARVDAYIKKRSIGAGEWVRVRDYDENRLPGALHPTLCELDYICPDRPMRIAHASGHSTLYNSRALEIAGIDDATPSPDGGEICKSDGHVCGYMLESACRLVNRHIPAPSREELRGAFIEAQRTYAAYGITTVQDGYLTRQNLEDYLEADKDGKLKLDIIGYIPIGAYKRLRDEFSDKLGKHVKIGGIKTFADGSPQLRTAWVGEPYLEGGNGIPNRSDEEMRRGMMMAAEESAQVLCHANGDAAIEQFLRALEKAEETHPDYALTRPVIVHGQLMRRDQLPIAKRLGAVVSFFVAHTYHWADVHIKNLGRARGMAISPVRSALGEGVHVTFHQDPPVILPDMLETLWCATCRVTRSGVVLEGEEISMLDAIRSVTIEAAYQYHEEDIKGTLEEGKYADFIILDRDPLEIPKEDIRNAHILATYKEGECVYESNEW